MGRPKMDLETFALGALEEDAWEQDRTSSPLARLAKKKGSDQDLVNFTLVARERGVFSGAEFAAVLLKLAGAQVTALAREAEAFSSSAVLIEATAPWQKLLAAERTLLNGLQYLCGVASLTRGYVSKAQEVAASRNISAPEILHTRKVLPGLRDLTLQAVRAGGGGIHRRDLSSYVLFKDNHMQISSALGIDLKDYIEQLKSEDLFSQAIFEVDNLEQLRTLNTLGVTRFLLDNFNKDRLTDALDYLSGKSGSYLLECSGSIRLESLGDYIQPGVTRLSIGALTHSVQSIDLSLDVQL